MKIIPKALTLAKLQRTSMTEEQIVKSYMSDYSDVIDNFPENYGQLTILDIGCGIGGWLCNFPPMNPPMVYLIDRTEVSKEVYYGYNEKTAFYNNLETAKENLIENGIPKVMIHTQEATDKNEILFDVEFDLIVSFISCGFHYPVETYLDQIYEKLKIGGTLIIDIRKGTNGITKIFGKFGSYKIIKESKKYWRIKATK